MSAQELFVESFVKWVSMAKQPHTSLRSPLDSGEVERVLCNDESRFTIWQSDGQIGVWRMPGNAACPNA
jgi:hypothetical protein